MPAITIATSIAPRNFELQRAAIDSWLRLGFNIISVNSTEESPIVAQHFPDISIRTVDRTAEGVAGKPYVFFDDVCAALLERHGEICGIVNSDIVFKIDDQFQSFVKDYAKSGLVFGSRIDIENQEDTDGKKYVHGFDFFFLDRTTLELMPESAFCLGVPWWDYWLPVLTVLMGRSCYEIVSPVAYHITHETRWESDLFAYFGRVFAEKLVALQNTSAISTSCDCIKSPVGMTLFSFKILLYILRNSNKLTYPHQDNDKDLIPIGRLQYLSMREELIEMHKSYFELQEKISFLETDYRLALQRTQTLEETIIERENFISAIIRSYSWRVTGPLRRIADIMRGIL